MLLGPLKINLFEPWNVATPNLSSLLFGSDLRELIILSASIEDKFSSLRSDIIVSNSLSKFLIISTTLITFSRSSDTKISLSLFKATI